MASSSLQIITPDLEPDLQPIFPTPSNLEHLLSSHAGLAPSQKAELVAHVLTRACVFGDITLLTFLPPSLCPNLREIELYFDVRGEDTEERLMRALVGTREHWKWIDTKFSSTLPALKMLTIRLEDNSVDAAIREDDKSTIREEIQSDYETGEGLKLFRCEDVQLRWLKSTGQSQCLNIPSTHPMRLCRFHHPLIDIIDPDVEFLEVLGSSLPRPWPSFVLRKRFRSLIRYCLFPFVRA